MGYRGKDCRLDNGLRLNYATQGNGEGVPLILLHGIGDSWRIFEPLLKGLPPQLPVYALTQRGHGDSDKPQEGYRVQDFEEDLLQFMEALEIPKAVIIGASSGGFTARRFAEKHLDRTAGLVLLGAPATLVGRENPFAKLQDPIDGAFLADFLNSLLTRPLDPKAREILISENRKVPAHVWRETSKNIMAERFPNGDGNNQAPTLIVWGDRDPIVTKNDQLALTNVIQHARLVIHEGAGHLLYWENPEVIAADLIAFLSAI